jgi:hypothetical protein
MLYSAVVDSETDLLFGLVLLRIGRFRRAVTGVAQLANESGTRDCQRAYNIFDERALAFRLSVLFFIHHHPYSAYYSA